MAINDTQSVRSTTLPREEAVSYNLRRQAFPAIRWGAILAGVAVGISIQLALTLLGIATGLSTTEVTQGESVGTGPLIWAGVSMLVAAFVGGYVAARMSGLKRKADGVLHGAVSWAVTTILFAVLATSVGGTLVGSVFNNMSQLAQAGMQGGGNSPIAAVMQSQGAKLDQASMQQFQQYLQAGQREPAIQLLSGRLGIDQTRAAAIVDQALIMMGSPQSASPQGRQSTEHAVQRAGTAAWVVFLAVALALAIGIGGGALGAAGSRRVSWTSPQG
ncbi:hypothetical protein [Noviherbaspirillum denitrificans]|uniref:PhnA-like protein n=1 Tax=Noviherbaspirillum denitrificans TaxID=1968433 RepID=A0A254TJ94_9BURK|nr:hypothetical protein [Noviherbaspirillum denitrificans]OWW19778.1 hypothetical protein AYR66_09950 [Noviherbaspirillum denitrificans]